MELKLLNLLESETSQGIDVRNAKCGDALYNKEGVKVDEVERVERNPLGGYNVFTRAGFTISVDSRADSYGRNVFGWSSKKTSGDVSRLEQANIDLAKILKSGLAQSLFSGDTETDDGTELSYGDIRTMVSNIPLGGLSAKSRRSVEHAQFAINQMSLSGRANQPISKEHAKLVGAALLGKTEIDDDGRIVLSK